MDDNDVVLPDAIEATNQNIEDRIADVEKRFQEQVDRFEELSRTPCYAFFASDSIEHDVVDDVYDDLRKRFGADGEALTVIVDSAGGNIHAAFNLGHLFRRYGSKNLAFAVPRWAKSAATLLVCAGDRVRLTPVAELGPIDPQITEMNPLERRLEQISPLHIEATLALIRDEYKQGNAQLADGLLQRLQFPLTLGSFKISLEVGKDYLKRLLSTRMLAGADDETVNKIAHRFTEGYTDHGFCIGVAELREIGLLADEMVSDELEVAWELHKLNRERVKLERERKRSEMGNRLNDLPPELLDLLTNAVPKQVK